MSDEVCFVAATKADLSVDRAVWLDFSPSIALGFVHFVIALPGEGDIVAVTRAEDLAGDASEGEFAGAIVRELNVGGLHHVAIVPDIVGHRNDSPATDDAHAGAAKSLGKRIRF
ncbi:hypothetical protein [Mesorhizobium sp. CO1-1-3]|uniref:hypothetical protein n=1 Tax=Mesorhizobium sp. CO1-1-3 TaxID=2876634 RepID=UPI001CCCB3EB|nr:hypothetical protein [Mesorhizobium sp. CO1-1-3]